MNSAEWHEGYRMGEMERMALATANSELRTDLMLAYQQIDRLMKVVATRHDRTVDL